MEIDLGSNIDVAWTDCIGVRAGAGAPWTTINTLGLTVMPRIVSPQTVGANDALRRNGKEVYMISLMDTAGYEIQSFDLASISNQATWSTGTLAGLIVAVDDLTTWISSTSNTIAAQMSNFPAAVSTNQGAANASTIRVALSSDALPSGENHIGAVGGNTGYVEVTMVLDTAIYASGDVLTDTVELTGILRLSGGTGVIHSIHILDEDHQAQALDVVFFRTNVSLGAKNAAVSITDANAREILGTVVVTAADYVDLVNSSSVTKTNLGIGAKGDALDDLFMSMISRGTGTYTASGITVKVVVLQD